MPEEKTKSRIKSALHEYTSNLCEPVKLRFDSTIQGSIPPVSIPDLFEKTVQDFPQKPALSFKDESGQWQIVTYQEYKTKVCHIAKTFIKLGLEPRDVVVVAAFNCPEWFFAELGAIYAGGVIAGSYTTNSSESIYHILSTSQAKLMVVDDKQQMQKVREIWSRLPNLKAVIQINGPFETDLEQINGYYRWSNLEQMDTCQLDTELKSRIDNVAANKCCLLTYTSGTTGLPKAAMLSHDNLTWNVKCIEEGYGNVVRGEETTVSYLPMSHMAAQMVDVFLPISSAGCVYFADRDALRGSLIKTLQTVHPTRIIGVPRVYEKIYEQMKTVEAHLPKIQNTLLRWARNQSLWHTKNCLEGKQLESWHYKFAKRFVLHKVKHSLGLDKFKTMLIGGAPVSVDLKMYFLSIDCPITEMFGMTESTVGHCMANSNVPNLQTVGLPLMGIATKVHSPDETGAGEICLKSRSVFMGYLNDPEKTREIIDDEGWLHTGDLGKIDEKGYVYITGRLKELVITAGGENVAPVLIENVVKSELAIISNAVLIGDKRKYLTMLITLKVDVNPETGIPSDNLLPVVQQWLETLNLSYTTVTEILQAGPCPIVLKAIQDGIGRANQKALSNAQKIQKFVILPQDFSMASGELGPTLKLKRSFVYCKYQEIIDALYK